MPDAPAWLREGFRDGVDEGVARITERIAMPSPFNPPARHPFCWLAKFDPACRPCTGRLERFHFIGRQRVREAFYATLPTGAQFYAEQLEWGSDPRDLLALAEWDARNGGMTCEGHHRRFDNHATPDLVVPLIAVPNRTIEFAYDWGIEAQLEKFPT